MARILLAWELGANLGHVSRMQALAQVLTAQGHDCLYAASDLRSAEEWRLAPVFQAPVRAGAARNPVRTQVSYASLLNNSGYDDVIALAGRLRGWRALLQQLAPDLLLADHAPTALVAARSLALPAMMVGTGFTLPPLREPFPVFQPDLPVDASVLRHNEAAVLQNLNQALQRLDCAPLQQLQDIFQGVARSVLSYPELDHYEGGRADPYLGVPDVSHGAAPEWPAGEGPKILAYLRPSPHLETALKALCASRARVLLRVGGLPPGALQPYLRAGLRITDQAIHMRQAAAQCDAFVNYASHGFTAEMLLAGKPGLLLPDQVERSLVARRTGQLGATLSPSLEGSFNLSEALRRIVEDPALRRAAEDFAQRHGKQDRAAPLQAVAAQAAALSAAGRAARKNS